MIKGIIISLAYTLVSIISGIAVFIYPDLADKIWTASLSHAIVFGVLIVPLYHLKNNAQKALEETKGLLTLADINRSLLKRTCPTLNRWWLIGVIVMIISFIYPILRDIFSDYEVLNKWLDSIILTIEIFVICRLIHQYYFIYLGLLQVNEKILIEKSKDERRRQVIEELKRDKGNHDFIDSLPKPIQHKDE